jgi:hypothetical protein
VRPLRLVTFLAAFAWPTVAFGQAGVVNAMGLGYQVQYHVRYAGEVEEQTGMLAGGQGWLRLGVIEIGGQGLVGQLVGGSDTTIPDRTVRFSTAWVNLRLGNGASTGMVFEARRYETALGTSVWRLLGGRALFSSSLGPPGFAGVVDVTYFFAVKAPGLAAPAVALRGEVGVVFAPGNGPIVLQLTYRFERFDFRESGIGTDATAARLEQGRGLVAGLGLRLGR